jgi:hypothetical protein
VDRHLATRREEEGDKLSVNIVIRKWLDFRPEFEFRSEFPTFPMYSGRSLTLLFLIDRGFVYDRQLTAGTHR